jgi:hypothetical protein
MIEVSGLLALHSAVENDMSHHYLKQVMPPKQRIKLGWWGKTAPRFFIKKEPSPNLKKSPNHGFTDEGIC